MGIKVDNTTDLSQEDDCGKSYAANFEFFPFHEGKTYSLYKGVLNGDSIAYDRHGQRCVVRTFRNKTPSCGGDWADFMHTASKADEMAAEFHKKIGRKILSFPRPLLSNVNQKSSFVWLFRKLNPHEKRLKSDEMVIIEPFLRGAFSHKLTSVNDTSCKPMTETYGKGKHKQSTKSSNAGERALCREDESYPEEILPAFGAFSHFTWHATKKFIVTDLQGSYNQETSLFTLTNPTIHSIDQSFGETDRGLAGIEDFFDHHECHKSWCSTWCRYEAPDPNGNSLEPFSSLHQPD